MNLTLKDEQRLFGYASDTRGQQQFTNEQMLLELRNATARHGNAVLTRKRYQEYYEQTEGVPHPYTIIRRFGKWSDALKTAGLESHKRAAYSNRVEEAKCIEGILQAHRVLGHLPSVGEYHSLWQESLKDQGFPSEGTIRLRFNHWRTALKAASED